MTALLLRQSLDVHTGDGLNLWIPVRDEPAALRLLAEQGIRVAAGKPFLPSLRISADATGADAGAVRAWTRMPVEASASPSHIKWPPPPLRRRPTPKTSTNHCNSS